MKDNRLKDSQSAFGLKMGGVTLTSSGSVAPIDPVVGYSAWFDAGNSVFSDVGGTVPAVNGGPVASWASRGGSAGTQLHVQTGAGLLYNTTQANNHPVIAGNGSVLLRNVQAARGSWFGASGESTIFAVAYWVAADDTSACGTQFGFAIEQRLASLEMANYWSDLPHHAFKSGDFSGAWHCATSMAQLSDTQVFLGVDDTRTASLAGGGAGGNMPDGSQTELLGALTSRFLATGSYLAEVIIYPTTVIEPDRKLTEQYLAAKYGIVLPY